ncbi:TolB family protein [candidate division KSB1 bacterium]
MKFYLFLMVFILLINEPRAQESIQELSGPYLGQKPPAENAGIFLDGIISKLNEPEMCAAFSRDGREFFFNKLIENTMTIFYTREINGKWTAPQPVFNQNGFTDRDFNITPDGSKIFFGSNRPGEGSNSPLPRLDIFVTRRIQNGKWSIPENIGSPVNTELSENYPSIAENGNLYFFSQRTGGFGGCDIYMSMYVNGRYTDPVNLGPEINSEKNDWDSYIAPDESYIIFSSQNRDDTIGGQDLYISFRRISGTWTKAVNMGRRVNSGFAEICPSVTLDGKYLFFTSRRRGNADIFWIDAGIIETFKPAELK